MRKVFILSGVAVLAGIMAGCGGGGGGGTHLNSSSKIVVGYVYVSTNLAPAGSPGTVITSSTTAPDGYAAPTAGTVSLDVANGSITRVNPAHEDFDMAVDGNAVIARVTSLSSGVPSLSFSATGLQLSGTAKPAIPSTTVALTGTNDSTLLITYLSPTYTVGAPASIKVLVADPSGTGKFGAPGDIIPSIVATANVGDAYNVAVIAMDANGVVIPGTTPVITDPNANATQTAVTETGTTISPAGGGVEGVSVPITFSVTQAPALSTTFSTTYTYGPATGFTAAFTPVGPTALVWPGTAVPAATQAYSATVTSARGVVVPNLAISFTRADTATLGFGAAAADPYPSPATGSAFASPSATTNASGIATVTFQTPAGAVANNAFNGLAIKGADKLQIRAGSTSGTVMGFTTVTIQRPLGAISIAGPTSVHISTNSPATGVGAFLVTGATDIDGMAVTAPSVTWNIANAATGTIGNTGDSAVPTDATSGSSFTGNTLTTGTTSGQLTVTASGGVTSNALTVKVLGLPQRVFLTPDTSLTGTYTGPASLGWFNAVAPNTNVAPFSVTVLDSGGNDLVANSVATVTTLSITNTSGTTFIGGAGTTGSPFIVQSGNLDGSFTVNIAGVGVNNTPYSLQKVVGVNLP